MGPESILVELQSLKQEIFNGKARNISIGEHKSRFGGFGYEIRDVERWERGDLFSSIDWNLSLATWPEKIYKLDRIETKETPVAIVADCSHSMLLGFNSINDKFRLLLHLIGTFSFTASYFHDPITIALASIDGDAYVPLRHGHGHVMETIYRLLDTADEFHKSVKKSRKLVSKGLSLNESIELIGNRVRRQSSLVVISDFVDAITGKDPLDMEMLEYLSAKTNQNVIALFLEDDYEFNWQGSGGTILVRNIETGRIEEVKAKRFRSFLDEFNGQREALRRRLSDVGVESVVLSWNDYFSRLSDFMMSRK